MGRDAVTGGIDGNGAGGADRRIVGLDGVRGAAALMVVISHYFGEVPHGVVALMFGWIGVDIFFVLSGLLIGRLILDKKDCDNFFQVFYVRRFFRIIPAYILTVCALELLIYKIPYSWTDASVRFPAWSYLTFLQGVFMLKTQSIGAHWLAPTWTLAVEEHFYLLAPAMIVFAPRRWMIGGLIVTIAVAVTLRCMVYFGGFANEMFSLALLPGRADLLACGLLAAVALNSQRVPWAAITNILRITPVVALVLVLTIKLADERSFAVFSPLILGIGCAAFLLCIVLRTPEAHRFESKVLRFFGDNAYCTYLTHLPVLGLMHGLILGAVPDVRTPAQWLVTLAALPVCFLVGWAATKLIEEPLTRYGRNWKWSRQSRRVQVACPVAT